MERIIPLVRMDGSNEGRGERCTAPGHYSGILLIDFTERLSTQRILKNHLSSHYNFYVKGSTERTVGAL